MRGKRARRVCLCVCVCVSVCGVCVTSVGVCVCKDLLCVCVRACMRACVSSGSYLLKEGRKLPTIDQVLLTCATDL